MSTEDDIKTIMAVADCSREVAQSAYARTKSVVESIDSIVFENKPKLFERNVQPMTTEQKEISRIRNIMKENDDKNYKPLVAEEIQWPKK